MTARKVLRYNKIANGDIAQLVARLNGIQKVRGSTPLISTTSGQGYFVHRCYCNGLTYEPSLPFSQKSFAMQNLFGSPNNTRCPRCVFHTPKSTKLNPIRTIWWKPIGSDYAMPNIYNSKKVGSTLLTNKKFML